MIPALGTRYRIPHVPGVFTVLEYAGLNPHREFVTQDAHLLRVVSAPAKGYRPGHVIAVEPRWFETHQKFKHKES